MIHEPTDKFEFSKLTLCKPISNAGGSFFIKYAVGEQPLYIQPPKCYIKQVVAKTAGKKMYCDLVFQQENDAFIRWMENLETHTQQLLYDHRTEWFKTDLERDDIEQSFTSPMKVIKSGKQYIVRATIHQSPSLRIYDEDEKAVPIEAIVENTNVMVILEIQGVRSGSNFQVDIEIKQMMVMKPTEIFNTFLFKKKLETVQREPEPIQHREPEPIQQREPEPIQQREPEPIQQREPEFIINKSDTPENIVIETDILEETADDSGSLCEVDLEISDIGDEAVKLKERKEMYYQMYQEARQKARVARDLALSAYLEAKQIKNKYMLDDILDSSSDESGGEEDDDYEKDE